MTNLDSYQQMVVKCQNNLLVIAGPGSGKTTTILKKVEYLLNFCQPKDILLISFTNKSVSDIKNRLKCDIFVTTFHKLAIDVLDFYNYQYCLAPPSLIDFLIDEYFLTLRPKETKKLCQYLNILKLNQNSKEYISLKNLIKTFINLYKTTNKNTQTLKRMINEYQDKYLLKIILDILNIYEEEKKGSLTLDFDDLIIKATNILKKDYKYKKFKYIIIDEFQDTSLIRLNLVKEIIKKSKSILTAVGDDAQSIFHFSGCDLNIFLNFKTYFENSKIIFLKNTYRNSQELIDISSKFINKNPHQIPKNMVSNISVSNPIEYIYYFNPCKALKKTLNKLLKETDDILILVRNKKDIYSYIDKSFNIEKDILTYKNHALRLLTIHSSKGLESKYVIILNVASGKYGIPNEIEDHPILKYVKENAEDFPFSEERRVFFVGITRCKIKTYLLIPRNNPSIFIKELKKII